MATRKRDLGPPRPAGEGGKCFDGRSMLERIKGLKDLVVINDEAHHVHDQELESHRFNGDSHRLTKGIRAVARFSATPQQGALVFPWVLVDYPLAQAVEDRIVKAPIIVRQLSRTKKPPEDPLGVNNDNVCEKFDYWLHASVERLKVHDKVYRPLGVRPVLFIMAERTGYADAIGKHLIDVYGLKQNEVLVIHTDAEGNLLRKDLDELRQAANEIDLPGNKIARDRKRDGSKGGVGRKERHRRFGTAAVRHRDSTAAGHWTRPSPNGSPSDWARPHSNPGSAGNSQSS